MPKITEAPQRKADEGPLGGYRETHPAYGSINVSHVSSNPGTRLAGSEFRHGHFIVMTISQAEIHHSLGTDRVFTAGHPELIRIALTENQWAQLVSRPNLGTGAMCTIEHINGKPMPGIEPLPSRASQFKKEVYENLGEVEAKLQEVRSAVEDLPVSRVKKDALLKLLTQLRNEVGPNIAFLAKTLTEHVEDSAMKAKMEVEGYIGRRIVEAGLKALGSPVEVDHSALTTSCECEVCKPRWHCVDCNVNFSGDETTTACPDCSSPVITRVW